MNNKVKPGTLGQILHSPGDHKWAPEQMLYPFWPKLEWPGKGPLFESDSNKRWGQKCGHYPSYPWTIPEVRPGVLGQISHPPGDHKWGTWTECCIFLLTQDRNVLQSGHYSSLHAFVSFKLPIPTNKTVNVTLLPQKSEKRCKREIS